jgi:hypothetical protein
MDITWSYSFGLHIVKEKNYQVLFLRILDISIGSNLIKPTKYLSNTNVCIWMIQNDV